MSIITTLSDENNSFLSRREIICDFKGLGGKLKKLEAVEMVTKEFKLGEKFVIPMKLQNHTGMSKTTGVFYVYDDETLAKKHITPIIFTRLDKAKTSEKKKEEVKADEKEKKEEVKADEKEKKEEVKADEKEKKEEVKADEKPTNTESSDNKKSEVKKDDGDNN
jgi:ribosomal protein S24E